MVFSGTTFTNWQMKYASCESAIFVELRMPKERPMSGTN
jgi:hypothetical protein